MGLWTVTLLTTRKEMWLSRSSFQNQKLDYNYIQKTNLLTFLEYEIIFLGNQIINLPEKKSSFIITNSVMRIFLFHKLVKTITHLLLITQAWFLNILEPKVK